MGIEEAKKTGAMALFGEKYGDVVRVVTFDRNYSVELCGGCHVPATGQIGYFKIISESAVAAGIRRIEAITSIKAEEFIDYQANVLAEIRDLLKNPKDPVKSVNALLEENAALQKQIQALYREKGQQLKADLKKGIEERNGINFVSRQVSFDSAEEIKNILFDLKNETGNFFCVLAAEVNGKPSISVIVSENLVKDKNLNASNIVRELAKEIGGGGGGQPFYAQAGGSNLAGLPNVVKMADKFLP
jgi:alanyl-tRNA synthetase